MLTLIYVLTGILGLFWRDYYYNNIDLSFIEGEDYEIVRRDNFVNYLAWVVAWPIYITGSVLLFAIAKFGNYLNRLND